MTCERCAKLEAEIRMLKDAMVAAATLTEPLNKNEYFVVTKVKMHERGRSFTIPPNIWSDQ